VKLHWFLLGVLACATVELALSLLIAWVLCRAGKHKEDKRAAIDMVEAGKYFSIPDGYLDLEELEKIRYTHRAV
jgi:hypothetical protein